MPRGIAMVVVGDRRIKVTRSVTLRCANRCKYVQSIATRNALSVLPRAFEARRTGLEPATTGSTGRYSNQLSYRPNC